jgi:predicted acylesterase/phospholipase RssA
MPIKHLVVSGGGQTMLQSLGAIQHLEQTKYIDLNSIETIYGTSAGALVAVITSLKYDWETVNDYIIKRPWHKLFNIKAQNIFDAYSKKGIFDLSIMEKFFKPLFDAKDISIEITMKEFYEYSKIELHIFAFEINAFEKVEFTYKTHPDLQLVKVIHMSCSLPVLVTPIFIENKCYIDGGIVCNYPLDVCIESTKNVDEILGFKSEYIKDEKNNIDLNSSLLDFIMEFIFKVIGNMETDSKQTKIQNEVIYKANHISINVLKNALYSVETRQELIQSGIDAAKEFIENKNILQNCV